MKNRYPTILSITTSCHRTNANTPPQLILRGFKLMLQLLVLMLFLTSTGAYAQARIDGTANRDSYIVNAGVYNKGVYKTFHEFKYNKPSITDHYIIEKGKIWRTYDTGHKKKIKKSEIWGYCSGDKIFVRRAAYSQIRELGRYCYFRDQGGTQLQGSTGFQFIDTSYKERMIIDFNTGEVNRLTTKLMKQILEIDDPDLLPEFMAETSKGDQLYEYLMIYNQRNKSKIK